MSHGRLALVIALVAVVFVFLALDLGRFLSLAVVRQHRADLEALYEARPATTMAAFFAAYVAVAALSLPGAAVMTLAAGALFGLVTGTVIVSFASSLGATLAFLCSRYLLSDLVQRRLGARLADVQEGVERDAAFYLFSLRLVPLIPFFAVNLAMGLTRIRMATFYLVSQVGMLAGTVVYVNAGTQLSRIDSLLGVPSPSLLVSFALLGLFPLAARKASVALQRGRTRAAGRTRDPPGA